MVARYLVMDRSEMDALDKSRMMLEANLVDSKMRDLRDTIAGKFSKKMKELRERAKVIDGKDIIKDEDEDIEDVEDDSEEEGYTFEEFKALPNKTFNMALSTFDFDEELSSTILSEEIFGKIIDNLVEKFVREAGGTFNKPQVQPNQNMPQTPQEAQQLINQAQQMINQLQQLINQ